VKTRKHQPSTRLLASFIRNLDYRQIPGRVLQPLGQSVADTIGCALLGSTTDFARLVAGYVGEWKSAGAATVWGTGKSASVPFAAMANSAACHAWDYDDTMMPSIIHPGSVAIPTAFAIAERSATATSGKALLTALAAGYEVGNVMGTALGEKAFASSGFYVSVPTIFVAVATAAKLMKLNEEQTVRALALAATQAAGLYSATLAKRFNSPKAVLGGIFAADLAQRGLEAPADAIEADFSGFLNTFSRAPQADAIARDLGKYSFEIFHKFYPCIRSNHPTVDNVRLMLEENPDVKPQAIRRIVSHVDQLTIDYTVKTTAGGAEGVRTPGNALVSLPYCVAAMVVDRELTLRQFTAAKVRNPTVQNLMKKIELVADPAIDKLPATQRYRCKVEIHLADGRTLRRALAGPKGDPNNRLTREEMREKFVFNASAALPAARAESLFELFEDIGRAQDIRPLLRQLRGSAGGKRSPARKKSR